MACPTESAERADGGGHPEVLPRLPARAGPPETPPHLRRHLPGAACLAAVLTRSRTEHLPAPPRRCYHCDVAARVQVAQQW